MNSRKRMALILPFAGLTGFGLGGIGAWSSGPIADAQACQVAVDNGGDCECVAVTYGNKTCSVSVTVTKDGEGNVISTEKSCAESPGCDDEC